MFNIMSLSRHHRAKNFSIPALFMPRLLAITLSSLTTYHHFRTDKESPGIVCQRVLRLFGKGIQVAKETSSYRLVYAI
jgi:hypothetical protein